MRIRIVLSTFTLFSHRGICELFLFSSFSRVFVLFVHVQNKHWLLMYLSTKQNGIYWLRWISFEFNSSKRMNFFSCSVDIHINNHSVLVLRIYHVFSPFSTWFFDSILQHIFLLRLQIPSRDLSGVGGKWPRWIRIHNFYYTATNPSKHFHSYIERSQLLFAEKFLSKNFCLRLGIHLADNYRFFFSFLCSFQRNGFYGVCKKKVFSRGLICHHSIENWILHITQGVSESTQVY